MRNVLEFTLISETVAKDAFGQTKPTPAPRSVYGVQESIASSEFFKASQAGLRPTFRITMPAMDYQGEQFIKIGTQEYTVYRTYYIGRDRVELYLGERVGNNVTPEES